MEKTSEGEFSSHTAKMIVEMIVEMNRSCNESRNRNLIPTGLVDMKDFNGNISQEKHET